MKKINVTFSLPLETHLSLQSLVEKRKMSTFVAEALNKALLEKKEALKMAYKQAEDDIDRKLVIEDWSILDPEGWE